MAPIDSSPLIISLATTCAATVATFFLGLFAACAMYRVHGGSRAWIDGILTLPLVLPPTVVGFFLLLIFGRRSFVGHLLEQIGVTIVFSWPATVIAATVVAFPLMYRTTLSALDQVNPTLVQAARILGASEGRIFRQVLLPIAAPGVLGGTILAFARAMGEFGATLMLAGNIPGRTQTMPIAIFSAVEAGDMHTAFVWVALIVVLSLAMIRLLHAQDAVRKRVRRTTSGTGTGDLAQASALEPQALAARAVEARRVSLEIDVEKPLESFLLRMKFKTAEGSMGLLGPSGAGKSMTLRLIAGIETPVRGRIVLNERTLFDSAAGINISPAERRVGVVFQDYALFPNMTVAENVAFGLSRLPRAERRARARRLLAWMQIGELADRLPREISGGQRQRVAIARCMATEPDALLLDEPFAALDPHLRRQTEEQLRATLRGYKGVVLFVTHDMEEAFRFCTDLLVLDGGKMIACGPKHALFQQPRTVASARLTGCKNIAAAKLADANHVVVEAWQCRLALPAPQAGPITHAGYRSHQFQFVRDANQENTFPCWLVETSEAPHEITLYLHLHHAPQPGAAHHVQADIAKDVWQALHREPQPWFLRFDGARLLLLTE